MITTDFESITKDQWSQLTFQVFDTPHYHESPFEERQKRIESIKAYFPCMILMLVMQ